MSRYTVEIRIGKIVKNGDSRLRGVTIKDPETVLSFFPYNSVNESVILLLSFFGDPTDILSVCGKDLSEEE